MSRIVLFTNSGNKLYLTGAKKDESGVVTAGWVENGDWLYRYSDGEAQADDGSGSIVNRWKEGQTAVVDVPDRVQGDYNHVITWAEKELARLQSAKPSATDEVTPAVQRSVASVYTGANLKHRALILLQENPIEVEREPLLRIVENPEMGEFRLFFRCANMAQHVYGALPITDLPEIKEALAENVKLQTLYAQARDREVLRGERTRQIESDRAQEIEKAIEAAQINAPGTHFSPELIAVIESEARLRFEGGLLAIRAERRADFTLAEPGMAAHDWFYTEYVKSVDERAAKASGLTRDEESALNRPSDAWHDEWNGFVDKGDFNALQKMLLRGFRAHAANRILIDDSMLRADPLRKIGDPHRAFNAEALESCVAFSNELAYKAAPFRHLVAEPIPDVTRNTRRPRP